MKHALVPLALAALLSGCAVYEPAGYVSYPPEGASYPYAQNVYPAQPVYAAPVYAAPVYAAPPVYAEPPVSFSFGFLFGGGHGGHHGGWGHHHR